VEQGHTLEKLHLSDSFNLVFGEVQEAECCALPQPTQQLNGVPGQTQLLKIGQFVQVVDVRQLVVTEIKSGQGKCIQATQYTDAIVTQCQHLKLFTLIEATDFLDLIVIEVQSVDEAVGGEIPNFCDFVEGEVHFVQH